LYKCLYLWHSLTFARGNTSDLTIIHENKSFLNWCRPERHPDLIEVSLSEKLGPNQKVVLYGSRDSFIPHYCGKYPTEELVPTKFISGKEIRKNVGIKSKGTKEFREGVVWAVENQWPSALPTVDMAIIDRKKMRLLVCRKPNEKLARFVGGFATPESECYEDDARREILEETHLEVRSIQYVGSAKIKDWRFKSERNKIKTILFVCDYAGGDPVADDDIAEIEWVDLDKLSESLFVEEHVVLFKMLKERVIDLMMINEPVKA
jgi:bifunctional NMN adenylyltransferase/nudix hydrolase